MFFDSLFILLGCQKDPEVHSRFSERMLGFVLMSTGGGGSGAREREGEGWGEGERGWGGGGLH